MLMPSTMLYTMTIATNKKKTGDSYPPPFLLRILHTLIMQLVLFPAAFQHFIPIHNQPPFTALQSLLDIFTIAQLRGFAKFT